MRAAGWAALLIGLCKSPLASAGSATLSPNGPAFIESMEAPSETQARMASKPEPPEATWIPSGAESGQPAREGMPLAAGDRVRTGPKTALRILLPGSGGHSLTLAEGSELKIHSLGSAPTLEDQTGRPVEVELVWGALFAKIAPPLPQPPRPQLKPQRALSQPPRKGPAPPPSPAPPFLRFKLWTHVGELSFAAGTSTRTARLILEQDQADPGVATFLVLEGAAEVGRAPSALALGQGFNVPLEHFVRIQGARIESPRPFPTFEYLKGLLKRWPRLAHLRNMPLKAAPKR